MLYTTTVILLPQLMIAGGPVAWWHAMLAWPGYLVFSVCERAVHTWFIWPAMRFTFGVSRPPEYTAGTLVH